MAKQRISKHGLGLSARVLFSGVLLLACCGLSLPSAIAQSFASKVDYSTGVGPQSVAVGDLNGDGQYDLAVANFSSNTVSVFINTGSGSFATKVDYGTGSQPVWVAIGDFNGDGKSDLAVSDFTGNTVSVLLNSGGGTFGGKTDYGTGTNPQGLGVADVNNDGKPDLVVVNHGSDTVSVLINGGSGSFATKVDYSTSAGPRGVACGDLNADGKIDLAVANNNSNTVSVLLNNGGGSFAPKVDYGPALGAFSVAIGDFNLDGNVDLAVADNSFNKLSVFLNSGGGAFSPKVDYTVGSEPILVAAGDFNLDGKIDLVAANQSNNTVSVLANKGNGTFAAKVDYSVGNQPISVATGDFNLDGKLDLAVANFSSNNVSVLLNTTPTVQFSSPSYTINEGDPNGHVDITLTRSGDTTSSASVTFATNDGAGLTNCNVINGIASPRCDYENTIGTATWATGDATAKTFSVAIVDDAYAEGTETFTIGLNSPSGATLGTQSTATVTIIDNDATNGVNPIDSTNFFVRQQYIDFLGREPDPPGFAGWSNTINNCTGDTTQCDRIHVSQLFFQSAEFQDRGYFVYRFYPVAFGRKPDYSEFVPDLASVSGFLDANQLEAAKVAFIAGFMARPAFVSTYNPLTNQQYMDMLLNTAGVTLSNRQAMIDGLNNATLTRAAVLRMIVESTEVSTKYKNQAYAVMEYFGYLRRQPDSFYLDWIAELDRTNNPRGMVTGFVNSQEYRNRFGP